MLQVVLFLAAVALVSYLIPVLAFLLRPRKQMPRASQSSVAQISAPARPAPASSKALDRLVELVEDDAATRPAEDAPHRSDKVVKLR